MKIEKHITHPVQRTAQLAATRARRAAKKLAKRHPTTGRPANVHVAPVYAAGAWGDGVRNGGPTRP